MKKIISFYAIWMLALVLLAGSAVAADADQNHGTIEDTLKKQQQTIDEQQKTINELKDTVDQVVDAQKKSLPSEFNPAIGLVGETIFSYRSRGQAETGSDRPGGIDVFQRSVELNAAASIDPFTKGYIVVNGSADPVTGEESWGIEEAALQTTSLPGNLEVKAGRFFGEFGRLGYIHDHELPFVNRPLVLAQYIGGESRTDGLQVNWLVPVEHYISLTLGAGDQFGGDNPPNFVGDNRNEQGLNYWGRLSTYFDLTPNVSLEPGISGLWNPRTVAQWDPALNANGSNPFPLFDGNTFTERERRLAGVDMVLSWKPLRDNQFEAVTWGTEVLYSDNRYDVGPAGGPVSQQSVSSHGLYSYLIYRWHRQWSGGVQYERLENLANKQAKTSAESANITWATSHWNQLRLQYTHTDNNVSTGLRPDDAVYLQWAWIIGSHSHGWQQR